MANTDIRARARVGAVVDNLERSSKGDLLVAQGGAPYQELSRQGDSWTVGTSTLLAPLTARPTTTAALEVYNNDATRLMVISDLYAEQILATAVVQTFGIYAMITSAKAVPSLTALSVFSNSGRALVTPTAAGKIVTGVGTTVVANGWRPWGPAQAWGLAAATPGNNWSVPVDGKLVVPFGCSICLHIVGSLATASSFHVGLSFNWVTDIVVAG